MIEYVTDAGNHIRKVINVINSIKQCIQLTRDGKIQNMQILIEIDNRMTRTVMQVFLFTSPEIINDDNAMT